MNGGAHAFRQPRKTYRRLVPLAVVDAFYIIKNFAPVEYRHRFAEGKRLHTLGGRGGVLTRFRCVFLLFIFAHQLKSRMEDVDWPVAAVSGSLISTCMVAQARSAWLAS